MAFIKTETWEPYALPDVYRYARKHDDFGCLDLPLRPNSTKVVRLISDSSLTTNLQTPDYRRAAVSSSRFHYPVCTVNNLSQTGCLWPLFHSIKHQGNRNSKSITKKYRGAETLLMQESHWLWDSVVW